MKNIIYILLAIMLVGMFSCRKETEDLFDKPASERLKASINDYKKMLESAENGWAFEYYCGGKDMKNGGFMLPLVFKDGKVSSVVDMYLLYGTPFQYSDTSNYSLVANGGVTLSFDEYNYNIHLFSDPNTFGMKPDGLAGDFEFLITGYEENLIFLKGKKYGIPMRMKKIEIPLKDYVEELQKVMQTAVRYGSFAYKQFNVNDEVIMFEKNNRSIICKTQDKDGKETETVLPYVFTNKGISFYRPATIKGVTFQHLNVDLENKCFKSADDKVYLYTTFQIPFDIINKSWVVQTEVDTLSSELFRNTVKQVDAANSKIYPKEKLKDKIRIGKTKQGPIGITMASAFVDNPDKGHIIMFETVVGINKKKELSLTLNGFGSKTEPYKHLKPLAELITNNSPYRYEVDKEPYPRVVKLISTKNADVWFTLTKK